VRFCGEHESMRRAHPVRRVRSLGRRKLATADPVQVHTREDRKMPESQSDGPALVAWLGLVDAIREGFPEFDPTKTFVMIQTVDGVSTGVVFWPPVDGTCEEVAS
jgi:hypothetical protein